MNRALFTHFFPDLPQLRETNIKRSVLWPNSPVTVCAQMIINFFFFCALENCDKDRGMTLNFFFIFFLAAVLAQLTTVNDALRLHIYNVQNYCRTIIIVD